MNKPLTRSQKRRAVFEAKHVSAFRNEDDVLVHYMPQLQHNMLVTGYKKAFLSVFFGNNKWKLYEVNADPIYQDQLVEQERKFWESVQNGTPPVAVHIPAPIEAVRRVDMSGSNSWATNANIWLSNKGYAKTFEASVKELKQLIEADVVEAYGAGIRAKRSKSGSITISEEKSK